MTQPLDPETDNSCWCSDRMSGGIPCPPGTCPNRPKLDPETERHIKWLTDSAAAMDPHCPEASNLYRKNGAHMRKLAQEVAERGINIDTLIRSRDTAQRELSWAQAALAAERTMRENDERELSDLRRQYDTLREKLRCLLVAQRQELARLRRIDAWIRSAVGRSPTIAVDAETLRALLATEPSTSGSDTD